MGIKWGLAGGYADDVSIATTSVNMGGSYFALPDVLSSNIALDAVNKGLAVGAVIDLIKGNGGVNTLSEPNLLCLNNIPSTLYVGKTQSILTSTATGNNAADITRNNYSREDIGLRLNITPQIADKDKVVLKVKAKIEDVDVSSNADRPTTTKREIDTTTIVQNGESVIIGGMLRNYESVTNTKVPFLGDIPFLGALFRSKNEVKDKISLVIIMTPYIVNSSLDLQKIQNKLEKLHMQKTELTAKMQYELDHIKSSLEKARKEKEKKNNNTDDQDSEETTNIHEQHLKMLMGEDY
jgi:general secretion pathway protein D